MYSDLKWDSKNEIQTPNIDRLCREGVTFSRAYTPSPVCVPARASKFWGQYPTKTGVNDNNSNLMTQIS